MAIDEQFVSPENSEVGIITGDESVPYNDWDRARKALYEDDQHSKNFMLWDRSRYNGNLTGSVSGVDYVLIGHTPVSNVVQENNIIRLDTGAVLLNKFKEFEKGFTILNMTDFKLISEV